MKSLPFLFEESVRKYPENPLMWEHDGNSYQSLSYAEAREKIHFFSAGLHHLGLKSGDRSVLLSEGRNAWVISEMSVFYCGGINVPLSVKLEESDELLFRINHSGARFVIVSQNHAAKIRKLKGKMQTVEKIIIIGEVEDDDIEISYDAVLEKGKEVLVNTEQLDKFSEMWNDVGADDICNICYTSGTTADPKGIMMTHDNYIANLQQSASLFDVPPWYTTLIIIPWDHAFGHTSGIYMLMYHGASFASIQLGKSMLETTRNIPKNIKEIKPVFILSVPALAKNFRKNIESGIRAKGKLINGLFQTALKIAYTYYGDGFERPKGIHRKILLQIFDKILFSKIRENFGGRLDFFVGGGALLDIDLQRFFKAIGMPMYQGYGLTEAAPAISSNGKSAQKMGSSGRVVPDLEIKILDDNGDELLSGEKGEIVVKGRNVMKGYWKNESGTAEALKDGWLYTGDMGYLDSDGFLYVLGRFKSLLIGGDGEKYSPEGIEEAMVEQCGLIDQCMLYNNQDAYTVAFVVPDFRKVKKMNQDIETIIKELSAEINQYKKGGTFAGEFPERWLPTAFAILPEAFTEQNRMLNSTVKMMRGRIVEHYSDKLKFLYTAEGKNPLNDENIKIVKSIRNDK